ncbi:hypothetical protein G2W53_038140 [Senna tora]|uniref:Uncharacterized protein n=1 Tax=Senna tora TaxID=362788 RepID=A0A834SYS7_9FABA|nr:hypothetical protein G2W53_038140 [Senna tora]
MYIMPNPKIAPLLSSTKEAKEETEIMRRWSRTSVPALSGALRRRRRSLRRLGRRSGGRRLGSEKLKRQQHLVHLVNRERELLPDCIVNSRLHHAAGDVHLIALPGEVEPPASVVAGGLGSHGVADGEELGEGVEFGGDVVEDELDLLLVGEAVDGAGGEGAEGVVGGGKDGKPLRG